MQPPSLDLTKTYGALLIGIFFSTILYGVTCTQVFFYYRNYPSDDLIIKLSVLILLVLETLHSAFGMHAIYFYLVTNYSNPAALARVTWSAVSVLTLSSGIVLVVHIFYVRRIYHLSRKNVPLVALLSLLALTHSATEIGVTVRALQVEFFSNFWEMNHLVAASLSIAAVTDVLIACTFIHYLRTGRSGIKSTDTIINKLMVFAIHNGLLTSLFDIVVLAFAVAQSDNLIFLAIYQTVGKLYTNSMMATLNARQSLTQHQTHITLRDSSSRTLAFAVGGSAGTDTVEGESPEPNKNRHIVHVTSSTDVRDV